MVSFRDTPSGRVYHPSTSDLDLYGHKYRFRKNFPNKLHVLKAFNKCCSLALWENAYRWTRLQRFAKEPWCDVAWLKYFLEVLELNRVHGSGMIEGRYEDGYFCERENDYTNHIVLEADFAGKGCSLLTGSWLSLEPVLLKGDYLKAYGLRGEDYEVYVSVEDGHLHPMFFSEQKEFQDFIGEQNVDYSD